MVQVEQRPLAGGQLAHQVGAGYHEPRHAGLGRGPGEPPGDLVGRQVHHRVHPGDRPLHDLRLAQVPEYHVAAQVPVPAGPFDVADHHAHRPGGEQARHQPAADPPGRPGDERAH